MLNYTCDTWCTSLAFWGSLHFNQQAAPCLRMIETRLSLSWLRLFLSITIRILITFQHKRLGKVWSNLHSVFHRKPQSALSLLLFCDSNGENLHKISSLDWRFYCVLIFFCFNPTETHCCLVNTFLSRIDVFWPETVFYWIVIASEWEQRCCDVACSSDVFRLLWHGQNVKTNVLYDVSVGLKVCHECRSVTHIM